MRVTVKITLLALLLSFYACDTELDDGAVPILPEHMNVESPDWGPDGRIIFSSWNSLTADSELWYCYENGTVLTRVTENEYIHEFEPSWSPDRMKVVCKVNDHYTIEDGLYLCDIAEGTLTPLVTGDYYHYPKWSPDGSKIAYNWGPNYDLFIIDAEGGTAEKLATDAVLVGWVANGEGLAYERGKGGYSVLVILYIGSGEEKEVYVGTHYLTEAAISPDGSWIAYGYEGNVYIIDPEGGEPEQLTTAGGAWPVGWSESGNKLMYGQWKGGLYGLISRDLTTGATVELYWFSEPPNTLNEMDLSPDGEWVAYDYYEDQERWVTDIYVANLKTGEKRKITAEKQFEGEVIPGLPAGAFEPTWSPDGKWVAFTSNRSGTYGLHKIRVFE